MKTKSLLLFFIKMIFIFIAFDLITMYMPGSVTKGVMTFKYGREFLAESIFALLVTFMLLMFKNSYIFTEKKESLIDSILLGVPMLVMSIISLATANIGGVKSEGALVNLLFFSIMIGIAEEFLCRGWIQNEFIERFKSNYKEVFLSIVLSSFIFGFMHITNVFHGQTLFQTILQILQATSLGFLLGSIYFRTKNIWAVVFLHSFYDFSLMSGNIDLLKDCTQNNALSLLTRIHSAYVVILLTIIFFVSGLIILRKSKVMQIIDPNDKKEYKDNKKQLLSIILFSLILVFVPFSSDENLQTCYKYQDEVIIDYTTSYQHKNKYDINVLKESSYYRFTLYNDKQNIYLKNNTTGEEIILKNKYYKLADQYEVIYNEDNVKILIFTYGVDSKVLYTSIKNDTVNNDRKFLESVKLSLKEYTLPDLQQIGYLKIDGKNGNYPLMVSELKDKFYIDDEGIIKHIVNQ